ncbi:MAG: hypothetical protein MMC23_006030 [Stictis urceolatum]|nr:hypothetical protein [Stictis urceolata]
MSSSNEPVTPTHPTTQSLPAPTSNPANPAVSPYRSLAKAVYERRGEYTRPQKVRIKVGSWNVAACSSVEKDLKGWLIEGKGISDKLTDLDISGKGEDYHQKEHKQIQIESVVDQEARQAKKSSTIPLNDPGSLPSYNDIGLYALGLQEVLDISSAAEALRPYNDPSVAQKWKLACADAFPTDYQLVAEQQLNGMLLLVYASPQIAPTVSSVSVTNVGTGLMGYMGNKGAAIARIVLGDTTRLVFVNSHLAAGTGDGNLDRRNWDASQIVQRTRFDPIDHGNGVVDEVGEAIGDEDFAFWFGDLNYRLATMPGDDVRRLLMLHTRNEYDVRQKSLRLIDNELGKSTSSLNSDSTATGADGTSDRSSLTLREEDDIDPENDPASLMTTLSSLLSHDQLHDQMRKQKAFQDGWREGPIKFLPTYKYDVGSVGVFDSSEKKRAPSWCDRILYRTRKDYLAYQEKVKQEAEAKKRDSEMQARGLDQGDDAIFDYDPDTDGTYNEYDEGGEDAISTEQAVQTREGSEDRIKLEYYTSHQRVLSSDHKPLDAIFELTYDAVDRELRARIQAEIAKEMDKDENESRPQVTLVVDHAEVKDGSAEGINYGEIKYDIPKTHHITVANTGRVSANVGFVEDLGDRTHTWLRAAFDGDEVSTAPSKPQAHAIEPGDVMVIDLTIHVASPEDARALNNQTSNLEDVRVLRVNDGRDHFITVKGTWLSSCFGLSLEQLIRVPEAGVRSCTIDSTLSTQEVKWSAPRELFRLTEALEESLERAVAEWGMKEPGSTPPWSATGWPFVSDTLTVPASTLASVSADMRESLDTNAPFPHPDDLPPTHKTEALSSVLLQFLASLDGRIVDTTLWSSISKAMSDRDKAKKPSDPESTRALVLDVVSNNPARSVAFTFITFMLARVVNEVAPLHDPDKAVLSPTGGKGVGSGALLGRVRGASEDPRFGKRREVERKFAEVFEQVVFRVEGEGAKEERVGKEKRRGVLGVFLHGKWGDG